MQTIKFVSGFRNKRTYKPFCVEGNVFDDLIFYFSEVSEKYDICNYIRSEVTSLGFREVKPSRSVFKKLLF